MVSRRELRAMGAIALTASAVAALAGCAPPASPEPPAVPHAQYTSADAPPDWIAALPRASELPLALWMQSTSGDVQVLRVVLPASACLGDPLSLALDSATFTVAFEAASDAARCERGADGTGVVVTDFTEVPEFGLAGASLALTDAKGAVRATVAIEDARAQ